MDTMSSASEVARALGTNVPRVLRTAERLGLKPRRPSSRRVLFGSDEVERLRAALGRVPPVPGLSRVEAQVLSALARSPRGLLSGRAVAARAAVSPTAAVRALERLEQEGLVTRERRMVALGHAREVSIWRAGVDSKRWDEISPQLAEVRAPTPRPRRRAKRVPPELLHLFWNTDPRQLELASAGGYIARRLIQAGDLDGLAWGAAELGAEEWRYAAKTRGLAPELKALAENLERGRR
jgi:DNA-binding Lrp family transcriptional regulator